MTYKMIDLCAGIGGIRRGFELAKGFKNVLSAEIDKYACMTYEHLYGENPENDITAEEFKEKVENTNYDILLAGFPCQAFSRAGKQLGFHDKTRGTLFFDIADMIKRTRPKAFMLENVDNLITHNKGETFDTIIKTLTQELNYKVIGATQKNGEIEYNARTFVRNSRNFGVPQNRPRVYIMGFDREYWGYEVDNLPNVLPEQRKGKIYNDLNDLLEMNAEPEFFLASGYVETLERHKARHESKGNGFGYKIVNLPEIENPVSNALLATGGSGKERNLVIDMREGIAGMQLPKRKTPLNDRGIRVMTPREWGKLQGFINYGFIDKNGNDAFSFPTGVGKAQQYKQFGNAVTIPAVEEMAKFMKKCLKQLEEHKKMKGNKGEWSELYTLLKLAADGRLYAADKNTNKIESIYYDILKIIRSQKDDNWQYIRNGNIKIIAESTGTEVASIPISEFKENAELLLSSIKSVSSKEGSFEVPEVESFISKIKCNTTKAKSSDKADITLMVHDVKTGSEPTLGFSIKSQLGSPSTLFNASGATNFIYELSGHALTKAEKDTFHNFRLFKDKFEYLDSLGVDVSFVKPDNDVFNANMMLVDTNMSLIIGEMLENFYRGKANRVAELTDLCADKNICNIGDDNKGVFYAYKIKELMTNIALGMMPASTWNGNYEATGGYIIVKEDGNVLCYHIYNRNEFREYLYNNTRFDTPSKSKHHFGVIEEADGKQILKLNLQIRFVK